MLNIASATRRKVLKKCSTNSQTNRLANSTLNPKFHFIISSKQAKGAPTLSHPSDIFLQNSCSSHTKLIDWLNCFPPSKILPPLDDSHQSSGSRLGWRHRRRRRCHIGTWRPPVGHSRRRRELQVHSNTVVVTIDLEIWSVTQTRRIEFVDENENFYAVTLRRYASLLVDFSRITHFFYSFSKHLISWLQNFAKTAALF